MVDRWQEEIAKLEHLGNLLQKIEIPTAVFSSEVASQ
jgi:hypothetical protein